MIKYRDKLHNALIFKAQEDCEYHLMRLLLKLLIFKSFNFGLVDDRKKFYKPTDRYGNQAK